MVVLNLPKNASMWWGVVFIGAEGAVQCSRNAGREWGASKKVCVECEMLEAETVARRRPRMTIVQANDRETVSAKSRRAKGGLSGRGKTTHTQTDR